MADIDEIFTVGGGIDNATPVGSAELTILVPNHDLEVEVFEPGKPGADYPGFVTANDISVGVVAAVAVAETPAAPAAEEAPAPKKRTRKKKVEEPIDLGLVEGTE